MADAKQLVNGTMDASYGVSARQEVSLPCNRPDAACTNASQQDTGAPYLAPLLAAPADLAAGPEGRADLLRRTLTSPWRLLAPRRAVHAGACGAGVERSCHAIGRAAAAPNTAVTGRDDISAPGRVDRRSAAGAPTSHRSLFTIDGLPEDPAPVSPFLTLHPPNRPTTDAVSTGDTDSSGRQAPQPLHHAATDIGIATASITAGAAGNTYRSPQPVHLYNRNPAQTPGQPGERSWHHRLAGRIGGSASSGPSALPLVPYPYGTAVGAHGCPEPSGPHPPYPPYPLAPGPQQPGSQQQRQPAEQPPPPPSEVLGATGLLGAMHNLLQLPGGADAFVHGQGGGDGGFTAAAAPAATSAEPLLPLQADRSTGAVDRAPAAAALPLVTASPSPPGPVSGPGPQLHCDDVRNPMSFHYDPSLDPFASRPRPQPQQQPPGQDSGEPQQGSTALPYDPHASCGNGGANGGLALAPATPTDASAATTVGRGGRDASVACRARQAGNVADASAGARSTGGGGGVGGVDVVAAEGPFVVLEMKGPRGTPSTHAAAAAAFATGASASPAAPDAAVAAAGMRLTLRGRAVSYFTKWLGVGDTLMPADQPVDVAWSWLGAFLSISVVALLNQYLTPHVSLPLMIASFGASAVLLFGVPASKLAQPRNFLGGQVVSALVGVCVRLVFRSAPDLVWLSAALGMSTALAAMQVTRTVHPPGGASALIAASATYIGPWYGFKFVLTVFFGSLAMLMVALGVNNLSSRRRYPTYWMGK